MAVVPAIQTSGARRRVDPSVPIALVAFSTVLFPWSLSGQTRRTGFGLAHATESAGLIPAMWARLALDAVYCLPALGGLACVAVLLGRAAPSRAFAGLVGAIVSTASIAVLLELGSGLEAGPFVGAVLGVATFAVAVIRPRRVEHLHG
ncbi:MAG: hypothetical protein JWO62_1793 [Acidimicrobiaceae bacterium]|nr:hypothetical protein [Acidimicrobiaceae bacterium]